MTKRFYVFTGKGGVGKTTLAVTFAQFLKKQNVNVLYCSFQPGPLTKEHEHNFLGNEEQLKLASALDVPYWHLELEECAKNYIAKKLNSKVIASWIVASPFFRSLINMIPGFSYMIFLGQILEKLYYEDPTLTVVLDAPASGHALTMFEATKNFQEIFQSGIVFEDTQKMLSVMKNPDFMKIVLVSLPSTLAISETLEVHQKLNSLGFTQQEVVCNNCLGEALEKSQIEFSELPPFLQAKWQNEKSSLAQYSDIIRVKFGHIPSGDIQFLAEAFNPSFTQLV